MRRTSLLKFEAVLTNLHCSAIALHFVQRLLDKFTCELR